MPSVSSHEPAYYAYDNLAMHQFKWQQLGELENGALSFDF